MKQFPHLLGKLFNEPSLLLPEQHDFYCQMVLSIMAGNHISEPGEKEERKKLDVQKIGSTAIVPVHGTLVMYPEDIAMSECGCDMERLSASIDMVEHDSTVSRVVYDFRTPGGSVTGIPEVGRKIASSRKETIAFTASQCCSGGIWLASQCKQFYCTESSRVGSVGVYTLRLDKSKALEEMGVRVQEFYAGKYKLLGAPWKAMTDEEKSILQKRVDKIYSQFKTAMETHRVVRDEHFGNGLVFDGEEAADIGFVDGLVESFEDILEMES